MDKIRVFCGSEHRNDAADLAKTATTAKLNFVDNSRDLSDFGCIEKFKGSAKGFVIIPDRYDNMTTHTGRLRANADKETHDRKVRDILLTNFHFVSLLVDVQIGNRSMFYKDKDGTLRQKPIVIYDAYGALHDNEHPLVLLIETLKRMYDCGAIKQDLNDIFTVAPWEGKVIDDLQKPGKVYGSNTNKHIATLDEEIWHNMREVLKKQNFYAAEDFNYTAVLGELRRGKRIGASLFTSTKFFDDISRQQAFDVCYGLTERGIIGVSGMGSVGHMGFVHNALVESGGISIGWITPEVLDIECPPPSAQYIGVARTINERELNILGHANFSVIAAGGRGGAGTAKEACSQSIISLLNPRLASFPDSMGFRHPKPVFYDNRCGLTELLYKQAQVLGLEGNKVLCRSSQDVLAAADNLIKIIRDGKARRSYSFASSEPSIARY